MDKTAQRIAIIETTRKEFEVLCAERDAFVGEVDYELLEEPIRRPLCRECEGDTPCDMCCLIMDERMEKRESTLEYDQLNLKISRLVVAFWSHPLFEPFMAFKRNTKLQQKLLTNKTRQVAFDFKYRNLLKFTEYSSSQKKLLYILRLLDSQA